MKISIKSVLTLLSLLVISTCIVKSVKLKQNCIGYLELASNANSIELAQVNLSKATKYLESNNLTDGYTSVLWRTPDEDVSFWYNNLKESEKGLSDIDSTSTSLEKSNVLLKLRETLVKSGKKGDEVIVPKGLSRFPDNALWGALLRLSVIALVFVIAHTIIEL